MPRIWDDWLDCVIYLYHSTIDARLGTKAGGSGFLVAVKSEARENYVYAYAVTNAHVIEGGATVVRVNTQDDDTDIIDLEPTHWKKHAAGDDIAIALLDPLPAQYKTKVLAREMCTMPPDFMGIGPGDEAFMLSRFITHDGTQVNQPVVRFGNVAMKPTSIRRKRKKVHGGDVDVTSWLVETRSLSGMSGSPVFWYIPAGQDWQAKDPPQIGAPMMRQLVRGPMMLGVDWGHPAVYDSVVDGKGRVHPDGWKVPSNSGFMAVAPAGKLVEMLDHADAVEERRKLDEAATVGSTRMSSAAHNSTLKS